jgi:hypothetical protein
MQEAARRVDVGHPRRHEVSLISMECFDAWMSGQLQTV